MIHHLTDTIQQLRKLKTPVLRIPITNIYWQIYAKITDGGIPFLKVGSPTLRA